jgi:hypothetical protein
MVSPAVQPVAAGSTALFSITAIGASNLNGLIYLSTADFPGGFCCSSSSNPAMSLSLGAIGTDGTAILSFTPSARASASSYQVQITGNANAVTRTVTVTIPVTNPTSQLNSFTVASTGVDLGTTIAEDAIDPNYTLVSAPAGEYQGPNAYGLGTNDPTLSQGLPIGWPDNSGDKWIGPQSTATLSSAAAGVYRYRTTFDLTGFDPTTAYIAGNYYAADQCEIFLNGKSVALSANPQFSTSDAFALTSGFIAGVNTLDFVVTNSQVGPTGLRVQINESDAVKISQ